MEVMEMEGRYATALWPEGAAAKRLAVIPWVKQGWSSVVQGGSSAAQGGIIPPLQGGCL